MNKFIKIILFILINNTFATPESTVEELFNILKSGENKPYIKENVSQLNHALQAAKKAIDLKLDDEMILAALFHDIGHLCSDENSPQMNGLGTANHEEIGAKFLEQRGFSKKVTEVIKAHVDAKRYLVFKYPQYLEKLSLASQETLKLQGGPNEHRRSHKV